MKKICNRFKNNRWALISWVLLIMWMVLIFILSSHTADRSSSVSGNILSAILKVVYPEFRQMSADEQFIVLESYQYIIRKSAHFLLFGVLGTLSVNAYKSIHIKTDRLVTILSLATCVINAILDEIHQIFVPGRSCEITDILIDSIGSLLFIFLTVYIFRCIEKRKKASADSENKKQ